MSGKDHINIFPSRANLVSMKARIVSANKGHSLLKRKHDALELKLREIMTQRASVAADFNELFSMAIFSIAKANYLETDFKPAIVIGSERADAYMRLTYTKTIGLLLPTFEPVIKKPESLPFTGLSRGGAQVEVIREKFQELLGTIIILASFDYSIRTLQDSIRTTNMRLNGLEFVLIPRFANTVAYIREELDEVEREEFYRLKCSQAKQRALKKKDEKKQAARGDAAAFADAETWTGDDDQTEEEDKFVPLPLSIFMKKKFTSAAQTIISGHFPGSYEVISPTDSIVSGEVPTISKRSAFQPLIRHPKEKTSSNENVPEARLSLPDATAGRRSSLSNAKPKHVFVNEEDNKSIVVKTLSDQTMDQDQISDVGKTGGNSPSSNSPIKTDPALLTTKIDDQASLTKPSSSSMPMNPSETHETDQGSVTMPSTSGTPTSPSEAHKADEPSAASSAGKFSASETFADLPDTSMETSSTLIDVENLNEPSLSQAPHHGAAPKKSLQEMSAQTDITGRYPRRSEMNAPPGNWSSDANTSRSHTSVPGRYGRSSNTSHGNTSESSQSENEGE